MAKFTFQLAERKQVAEATMSFRLDLAGQSFSFQPGQFVRVGLTDPPYPDPKGNVRSFSIASAPADPFVLIAVRMTGSAFKRSLADVPIGTPVNVNGPSGNFLLDPDSDAPVVLFAGGIGITPFRSMIKHAREQSSARHLTLVYANRCPEQAAFLEELEAWAKDDASFHLLATMTQPEKSKTGWNGLTGYVDVNFVRQHLPEEPAGGCYVAGPPPVCRRRDPRAARSRHGRKAYMDRRSSRDTKQPQQQRRITMPEPIIAAKEPAVLDLAAGTYWWCRCGRSKNQPFCDGSHKGTGFEPLEFKLDAAKRVALCQCKHTHTAPFCDGTHADL